MDEKKLNNIEAEAAEKEKADNQNEEKQDKAETQESDIIKQIRERNRQMEAKTKEVREIMKQGKGCLQLEKPILARDTEITELQYDFTEITGLEYVAAMDSDSNASQIYRITYRQALALFACAAAKQTDGLDMQDIVGRIGMSDALEGVQLATLFFSASTRAGQLRILKKQ